MARSPLLRLRECYYQATWSSKSLLEDIREAQPTSRQRTRATAQDGFYGQANDEEGYYGKDGEYCDPEGEDYGADDGFYGDEGEEFEDALTLEDEDPEAEGALVAYMDARRKLFR